MNIELNPEKIIEEAAKRLADEAYNNVDAMQMLHDEISSRIDGFLSSKANELMEETLRAEMENLMTRQFQPVNEWGEGKGSPTTLREQLQKRAEAYWQVSVDGKGSPQQYGGKPRHQMIFEQMAKEQFGEAIKENLDDVIAGFREAMAKDASKMVGEHIERFIKAPARRR